MKWFVILFLFFFQISNASEMIHLLQYDSSRNLHELELSEDEYVAGILEAEMGTSFHDEALKAQAVISRTWYYLNATRHRGNSVCSLAHCQVWRKPSPRALKFARLTHGMILKLQGNEIFFASSCAQKTDKIKNGHYRCEISPRYFWKLKIPAARLSKYFGKQLPEDFKVTTNEQMLFITTDRETLSIRKDEFFEKSIFILGNQVLRSPYFSAVRTNDHIQFIGQALGHGRGFCQWGAQHRAQSGNKFREILKAYFPAVVIEKHSVNSNLFQNLAFAIQKITQQKSIPNAQFEMPIPIQGFFITFKDANGKTLGCSGEINSNSVIHSWQLQHHVERALKTDPRYSRPSRQQIQNGSVFFSLVISQKPLKSIYQSNPKNNGYLYESSGKKSILLPGEAKTARWALLELRRQAGFSRRPQSGETLKIITAHLYVFNLAQPRSIKQIF